MIFILFFLNSYLSNITTFREFVDKENRIELNEWILYIDQYINDRAFRLNEIYIIGASDNENHNSKLVNLYTRKGWNISHDKIIVLEAEPAYVYKVGSVKRLCRVLKTSHQNDNPMNYRSLYGYTGKYEVVEKLWSLPHEPENYWFFNSACRAAGWEMNIFLIDTHITT